MFEPLQYWLRTFQQRDWLNVAIFWEIAPCGRYANDVSEELITYIFRVENQPSKKPASSLPHVFLYILVKGTFYGAILFRSAYPVETYAEG
jgi:hypothetical protein